MQRFEYRVIPAPRRGEKAKGLKTTEARFAHALTQTMNQMAADGWEYLRADTLPAEERVGLTGRTTTFQHLLVFRRALPAAATATAAAAEVPAPALHLARPAAPPAEDEPAALPEPDALDVAARRAALIARPQFGTAPRLSAKAETGLAPSVGPAPGGGGQAAQ
ncbi:MAG: DUF4177 domain-containing protein [Gemmobacter sp.]|uniref:DUF4177 domain-containing protein n=1 Tax=Gemmobacter sp. TaxID=1898957 RepID=UPI00391B48F3